MSLKFTLIIIIADMILQSQTWVICIRNFPYKYDPEKKNDPEFFFHLETSVWITIANPSHIHTLGYEEVQGFHTEKNMCGEPSRLWFIQVTSEMPICTTATSSWRSGSPAASVPPLGQGHFCPEILKTVFSSFCYCWEVQSHSKSFVCGLFFFFFPLSGT